MTPGRLAPALFRLAPTLDWLQARSSFNTDAIAMKKALGYLAGIVLLALAGSAFRTAATGWSGGHGDVGFWWTVITCFLGIAGLGALIGTAIHTRPAE